MAKFLQTLVLLALIIASAEAFMCSPALLAAPKTNQQKTPLRMSLRDPEASGTRETRMSLHVHTSTAPVALASIPIPEEVKELVQNLVVAAPLDPLDLNAVMNEGFFVACWVFVLAGGTILKTF
mmetsp:Transcript_52280/g.127745  ORF Transcript_52280/g.127745 Transcript_52280/m.127745 type:complete len:124 (+) Transcript_52280:108-479(+)|eukprot:CAMPEP_0206227194 /NCGR_PEP_ID=MMETSP0047_2-20121206/8494_1 /ASSEMBLY_ACC=CAM_ASM_000192 /TAXON_ID=195065 /ORGANISM="Chroomonas mesostigmatica_cf, Strain CCMP1168" /LENGTH=123 /DNA_ID=CAMNT_0053650331 /DNA_START=73 /DNA_END=444 /DNA_ORIENTATION=-